MTIIEFYKKLSVILKDAREGIITPDESRDMLSDLNEESRLNDLDIEVSEDLLLTEFLLRLDDERSFDDEDSDDSDYYKSTDYSF